MLIYTCPIHEPFANPSPALDVLWRAEVHVYSICIDSEANRYGTSSPRVDLMWFEVTKRTPKGAWINHSGAKKFVNLQARKRFATPSKEEALESLSCRLSRQITILQTQLARAQAAKSILDRVRQPLP